MDTAEAELMGMGEERTGVTFDVVSWVVCWWESVCIRTEFDEF